MSYTLMCNVAYVSYNCNWWSCWGWSWQNYLTWSSQARVTHFRPMSVYWCEGVTIVSNWGWGLCVYSSFENRSFTFIARTGSMWWSSYYGKILFHKVINKHTCYANFLGNNYASIAYNCMVILTHYFISIVLSDCLLKQFYINFHSY